MSLFKRVVPFLVLAVALGACSSTKPAFRDDQLFSNAASPFQHNFNFASNDACEAARRALLSQGYMTTTTHDGTVDASKNFQPASDSHVVVEIHVVCTAADAANTSVVYVNAVQNGYALKKSDTSASVGLSIFGSLSLPIRTNNDAMVKISSETIQSSKFYDRFFELVNQYLQATARSQPVPHGEVKITPLPPPINPAPALAIAPDSAVPPAAVPPAAAATAAAATVHSAAPATGGSTTVQIASPAPAASAAPQQPAAVSGNGTVPAVLTTAAAAPSGASSAAATATAVHAPEASSTGSTAPAAPQ